MAKGCTTRAELPFSGVNTNKGLLDTGHLEKCVVLCPETRVPDLAVVRQA